MVKARLFWYTNCYCQNLKYQIRKEIGISKQYFRFDGEKGLTFGRDSHCNATLSPYKSVRKNDTLDPRQIIQTNVRRLVWSPTFFLAFRPGGSDLLLHQQSNQGLSSLEILSATNRLRDMLKILVFENCRNTLKRSRSTWGQLFRQQRTTLPLWTGQVFEI